METQQEVDEARRRLEAIAHRFTAIHERQGTHVQDYHIGEVVVRESWHPKVKKYILTVDGTRTLGEAERAVIQVLERSLQPPPPIPSPPPYAPPSADGPASPPPEAPPERRSS